MKLLISVLVIVSVVTGCTSSKWTSTDNQGNSLSTTAPAIEDESTRQNSLSVADTSGTNDMVPATSISVPFE